MVIATIEPVGDQPPPRLASFRLPTSLADTVGSTDPPLESARQSGPDQFLGHVVRAVSRGNVDLDALYRQYKDRGLEVLAVNLDTAPIAKIQAFVGEAGVSLRVGWIRLRQPHGPIGCLAAHHLPYRSGGECCRLRVGGGIGSIASVNGP